MSNGGGVALAFELGSADIGTCTIRDNPDRRYRCTHARAHASQRRRVEDPERALGSLGRLRSLPISSDLFPSTTILL